MKRICVFCGSRRGERPAFADSARELGQALAARDLELVFGGGHVGLMGVIADAVLDAGGRAIGVIPHALVERELVHPRVPDIRIVDSMHERKALMAELSDAFIAMPGGLGTLEEFFEALTWSQLGIHAKPVVLLNVGNYFDGLLSFVGKAAHEGFIRAEHESLILSAPSATKVMRQIESFSPPNTRRWTPRPTI